LEVPVATAVEVMVRGAIVELTESGRMADAVLAGFWLSATVTAREKLPVAVGVPEMMPLLLRLSPAGNPETDQA
jgi:hypothetical protein